MTLSTHPESATAPLFHVGILGATGAVGEELLRVLEERSFPVGSLSLFSSKRSAGTPLTFKNKTYKAVDVEQVSDEELNRLDVAFFSAGSATSKQHLMRFVQAGVVVIDNTSAFRMESAVPLVVPEVNPDALHTHRGLISNPNCSTIQMMAPLKALHELAGLERVVVSTYQAASGAGRRAMDELRDQTVNLLNFKEPPVKVFSRRLAFDVIPLIGDLQKDGVSTEEEKMVRESQKILSLPELGVSATCVRVPTFIGHCLSVNVELQRPFTLASALEALEGAEGVIVCEGDELPTTVDVVGQDDVWLGRVRLDPSRPHALNFWCAADNLRKGAASNAVQIAERLIELDLMRVPDLS